MDIDLNIFFFLILGIALIGIVGLPNLLKNFSLSILVLYLVIGAIMYWVPVEIPVLDPMNSPFHSKFLEYTSEIIVITSLFGAGVRIDRNFSWHNWSVGLRLVLFTMPLCIAGLALTAYYLLGLPVATAILLGAVLAPTDPVFANNVQVGPPGVEEKNEVKFGLTLEAGFNDGLAFPFVYLALALINYNSLSASITDWLIMDLLYGVGVGILAGLALGYFLIRLFFYFASKTPELEFKGGLYVIAAVILSYAVTEIIGGYGFLAAFIAGYIGRRYKPDSQHHINTVLYLEQIEQLILIFLLLALGGFVTSELISQVEWPHLLAALLLMLFIRPLSGRLAFLGCQHINRSEKWALGFLGIRGIGSFYYLAYAANHGDFQQIDDVWMVVIITTVISIFLHGISSKPIMNLLYNTAQKKD